MADAHDVTTTTRVDEQPDTSRCNGLQTTGRSYRNLSIAEHGIVRDFDVQTPLRDGEHLLSDVYRPTDDGRYPVLIAASPSPRQIQDLGAPTAIIEAGNSEFFASRGYVHVITNLRGEAGDRQIGVDPLSWTLDPSCAGCVARTRNCRWTWRSCEGSCLFREGDDAVSRFRFVEEHQAGYPVKRLCELVELSRSGFYAWRDRPACRGAIGDAELTVEIRAIHERSRGTYGAPRVEGQLRRRGRRHAANASLA